jgi:3-oxoacyl-[acyl-carrier protein] reductase
MDTELQGKVVLVTGASGGIGAACARSFAEEGAKLVLSGYRNFAAVEKLLDELPADGIAIRADVREESDVEHLFIKAEEHFGTIDIVVANAGVWPPEATPIHQMDLTRWNNTIATNLTGVFLCAREFFRILERRKPQTASLVIIGSTAAVFGEENHADYAASKAAVTYGLTKSLKNEIVRTVPRGRVNAVCPGWTLTRMTEQDMKDSALVKNALQTRAIRRIARAEDIAATVVFLASDRLSGHISGEIIAVSGGMEGRLLHTPQDIDPETA